MKIYYLLFIAYFLILFTSCKSITKEEYVLINDYLDTNGELLFKYLENDKTLSQRDKEIYYVKHRILKKHINNIK